MEPTEAKISYARCLSSNPDPMLSGWVTSLKKLLNLSKTSFSFLWVNQEAELLGRRNGAKHSSTGQCVFYV